MSQTLSYLYPAPSTLLREAGEETLLLSQYNGVEAQNAPCFFWGTVKNPLVASRCLLTLSQVVASSFYLSPSALARLRDPVVTAGKGCLRFEGFSQCAGVYARVDVLPDGLDGEFLAEGTTNVDFNEGMLRALSSFLPDDRLIMHVGARDVGLYGNGHSVIEKKVPLPDKWVRGLTTVPLYQSKAVCLCSIGRVDLLRLFHSLPRGRSNTGLFLTKDSPRPVFTPVERAGAVSVGGARRLHLLDPLLPYADRLRVFSHPSGLATVWQLYFKDGVRFSLSLSKECSRGFSGEGAALADLVGDVPEEWLNGMNNYCSSNGWFNADLFAVSHNLPASVMPQLTARLASMGLLGFDLDEGSYFYRRLPFNIGHIGKSNPRLVNAQRLIDEGRIEVLSQTKDRVEARVTGDSHTAYSVVLTPEQCRCTCRWMGRNAGERGECKHILATKILIKWKKN